jgi:hypothetical protein
VEGPDIANDGRTVTVRVPIAIRRRGGRKLVVAPDGIHVTAALVSRHIDSTVVKAIARAFRWREMLESGTFATIRDLAKGEAIDEVYLGRVLRLTLLAPAIVEAVLGGKQMAFLELHDLLKPFPLEWDRQLDTANESGITSAET